ncbi:MAG: hypothetical protein JRF42_08885 [Deltaproteobacteria bacterium]|nr:hypothetical protein [Deltaproteobacteria bacterium]MBW2547641.1 hypothetical protein [Deltaproteobacteria bacterium]
MKKGRKRIGRVVLGFVFLASLLLAYKTGISHEHEVSENLARSYTEARRELALCEQVNRDGDTPEQAAAPLTPEQAAFAAAALCEKYGRETKRIVESHARYAGVLADDGGYNGLSAWASAPSGAAPSKVHWRCEPGKLHVQLSSARRVGAHDWQTAQDKVLAELESHGFDASRDKLAVLVGPDDLYLELEAARAGNTALRERLKRMARFEARTASLSRP